jgi:hypothetical protein
MDEAADIAVSEARRRELAPGGGVEQGEIGRVVETQGAETATVLEDGARDGVEELGAGSGVGGGGEGVEVCLVGALRELGPAMEIGDTFAERAPFELAAGLIVGWPEDLEVLGARDGGLDAQDAAGLVVRGVESREPRVERS